jgi:hypothetical protein
MALAALALGASDASGADHGVVENSSAMNGTIIGAYIRRNAGTGTWSNTERLSERMDSGVVQRLLELAAAHRQGTPDTIVNEAVANNFGYVCSSYEQLQPAMRGCTESKIPTYQWKSPEEVSQAAAMLGFTCKMPTDMNVDCDFHGSITHHFVKFRVSPSVDGVRESPDQRFNDTANLRFTQGTQPILEVIEVERH